MADSHSNLMSKPRVAQLAWLAGLFEGEGWAKVDKGVGSRACMGMNMTDRDVLELARKVAGVGRIHGPYVKGNNKPIYQWSINITEDVGGLAMTLYSFMGARRRQQFRAMLVSWNAQPAPRRLKTHCIHGHALSGDNLCRYEIKRQKSPTRRCRLCRNTQNAANKRAARVLRARVA